VVAPADRDSFRTTRPRRAIGLLLADVPAFTAMAQEVEDAMAGGILRYSDRLKLLKRAEHFGIRRFDANLLIAMVQNRVAQESGDDDLPPPKPSWLRITAIVLAVQTCIVAAAWWVMR